MLAEDVLADLSKAIFLPPAVLLLGPPEADLMALSRKILINRGLHLADLRWAQKVTADIAREVVAMAAVHPTGDFLGFVLHLDGASEQAQNILLKILEEPPETARFILLCAKPPLPALASRCHAYRVHDPLSGEPVADDNAKAAAAAAVRAALTRDPAVLAEVLRPWGERCGCRSGKPHDKGEHYLTALSFWAVSQYRPGTPYADVAGGLSPGPVASSRAARIVLKVLGDYPRARSQNAAAAALSLAFLLEDA